MSDSPKRGNIRLEVMQEVTGKILGDDSIVFHGAVMDIAAGGLSLRSDSPLVVGEILRLTLPELGDIPAVTVDCEIRWNTWLDDQLVYQVGCIFKFAYKIDEERVARYVKQLQANRFIKGR